MCATRKIFGKIYLKAIRDTFFKYVVCNQGRDRVRHEGEGEGLSFLVWGDIQQKCEVKSLGHEWGEPSAVATLVANSDPL